MCATSFCTWVLDLWEKAIWNKLGPYESKSDIMLNTGSDTDEKMKNKTKQNKKKPQPTPTHPPPKKQWKTNKPQIAHWFRLKLEACKGSSQYLHTRCLVINWTLRNKPQWNFIQNENIFSFKKIHFKMLSAKCQPFCSGLSIFIYSYPFICHLHPNL